MKRPSWWLVALLCAVAFVTGVGHGAKAERQHEADMQSDSCDNCGFTQPEPGA